MVRRSCSSSSSMRLWIFLVTYIQFLDLIQCFKFLRIQEDTAGVTCDRDGAKGCQRGIMLRCTPDLPGESCPLDLSRFHFSGLEVSAGSVRLDWEGLGRDCTEPSLTGDIHSFWWRGKGNKIQIKTKHLAYLSDNVKSQIKKYNFDLKTDTRKTQSKM